MKKILFIIIVCFCSFSNSELSKGEFWEDGGAVFKKLDEAFNEIPTYVIQSNHNEIIFGLYESEVIGRYNLSEIKVKGWPLKYPVNSYVEPLIEQRYRDVCRFGCFGEDTESQTLKLELSSNKDLTLGCYGQSPLRYGDLDGNENNEIVLFLGKDLVVFSPESENIKFFQNLNVQDWKPKDKTATWITDFDRAGPVSDKHPQYLSNIFAYTSSNYQMVQAGYRGYAKLYFSDFDVNGKRDILVWRKIYQSNLRGDAKQGFTLQGNAYLHYELSDSGDSKGQYVKLETEGELVQQWLTASELTWSKGYPSKSECEGQEGQLIPEMHDPLLNDPDVLK